jgi:hypothetical protein
VRLRSQLPNGPDFPSSGGNPDQPTALRFRVRCAVCRPQICRMHVCSFCFGNALETASGAGRARSRFRSAEGSRNTPRRDNETMNASSLVTHHPRMAKREFTREPRQGSAGPRQKLSIRGRMRRDPYESGRQAEPSARVATLLRNHFREAASNTSDSHSQPDGLIAFLMPSRVSFRMGIRPPRVPPGRAVPAPSRCPDCRPGKRLFPGLPIEPPARARHASQIDPSQSSDWLFRASPGGVRCRRCTERAVAIPSSGIEGFFRLTDVYAKRENSVPTCKRGICVPSSTRVRRARTVTDGWAVTGSAPDVRIQWKQTGGLR